LRDVTTRRSQDHPALPAAEHPGRRPGAAAPHLHLHLLGAPTVEFGVPRRCVPLTLPSAALLARLALRGAASRADLAGLLYPDGDREQRLTNLRQRLQQLRGLAPGLLVVDRTRVALADGVTHDLQHADAAFRRDPQALPGTLLGGFDFASTPALADWVRGEHIAWTERRRELLTRLVIEHEAGGRIATALPYAARLVADEPTHEHGVRLLMRLHYRRGDRGAALAAYDACVRALHDQFGDAVSSETAALAEAIARGSDDAPAPLPAMPVALRHPPRLVGREAVLQTALRRWQDDGVVLLAGPAGIGKTRLFDELCRHTGTRAVVRLAADDGAEPLGLLRRLVGLLAGSTGAQGTAASLTSALRSRLAAVAGPGGELQPAALGIEDLHFADEDSLAALATLLPPAAGVAARWCLTTRPQPLSRALGDWLDRHDAPPALVELPPWTEAQIAEFVASLGVADGLDAATWAAALHRHCGGWPLYVLWVLRSAHEQGCWGREPPAVLPQPHEVRSRIARTLDRCDPPTQQLAFVAALAGADLDAELVARVTGRRAVELAVPWRRLEAMGVLRGAGFSHEMMRLTVADAVPAALRPLLHADIASALPDRGGIYERRAAHWQASGRLLDAAADLTRAADEALALGLPLRALDLLTRAEQLHEGSGDGPAGFELRWRAARLAVVWDSVDRALAAAEQLLAAARDERQRSLALSLRAYARAERHDAQALEDADAAAVAARACGDRAALQQARLRRGAALNVQGRWQEALVELDALRGERLAPEDVADLDDTRWVVLSNLGRRREAVAGALAARDRALAAGRWQRACELASVAGVHLCYLGELQPAIRAVEQAIALAHRVGADRGSVCVDQMTLAGLYLDDGRFAEAVRLGEDAAAGLRQAGLTGWIANADNSLASMFMQLGRHDLAARRLASLPDDDPVWTRAAREMMRGVLEHRRSGASPLAHLQRAMALMDSGGAPTIPFIVQRIAVELACWIDPDEGLRRLDTAARWSGEQQQVTLHRLVKRQRVNVLVAAGRAEAAAVAAQALEDEFDGRWAVVNAYLPDYWHALVRAWDAAGQASRADAWARRSAAWIGERLQHDVPAAFADSFLRDNRTNRWLLQRAGVRHAGITVGS
jgi:DNA-binding SARP family transcriptional activator/tetratricopeptide (TPR) repeat protein